MAAPHHDHHRDEDDHHHDGPDLVEGDPVGAAPEGFRGVGRPRRPGCGCGRRRHHGGRWPRRPAPRSRRPRDRGRCRRVGAGAPEEPVSDSRSCQLGGHGSVVLQVHVDHLHQAGGDERVVGERSGHRRPGWRGRAVPRPSGAPPRSAPGSTHLAQPRGLEPADRLSELHQPPGLPWSTPASCETIFSSTSGGGKVSSMATMRWRVESFRSLSTLWYPGLYDTTRQKPGAASTTTPRRSIGSWRRWSASGWMTTVVSWRASTTSSR